MQPGDPVGILLPAHWQTACVLLGCWLLGARATFDDAALPVLFATEDALPPRPSGWVVATSLRPLGGPLTRDRAGIVDYPVQVRAQPDAYPEAPADPALPLVEYPDRPALTGLELVDRARAAAAAWRVDPGDRLLSGLDYRHLDGLLVGLLVPLVTGGGAVLCRHADLDRLAGRAADERVAAVAGFDLAGLRRLD